VARSWLVSAVAERQGVTSKMKTREEFLAALRAEFPEAHAAIDDIDEGLLHLEVAAFRRTVEDACKSGRAWYVEKAMRFVEKALADAGPELENALAVSFIEDFALGEFTPEERKQIVSRTPRSIVEQLRQIHHYWK
jgi:hypothetical protein